MEHALLEVQNLNTYFYTPRGVAKAVNGVSFKIRKGRTLSVVGESGCGKSVTGLSIMRLLPPAARVMGGSILYDGVDLLKLDETQMNAYRGREISMIFQEAKASLDPVMSVEDQIIESLNKAGKRNRRENVKTVLELLERVHIKDVLSVARSYPFQLSGGMCQRIMIAIAMCGNPGLLIADEPTTALDVTVQMQILQLMNELQKTHGMSMLLVTHDMGVVARMADDVAVMYCGNIVEMAEVEELFRNPLHPYTRALLRSIPSKDTQRLSCIEGSVSDLIDLPAGCVFYNRCDSRSDRCGLAPSLVDVGDNHWVSCTGVISGTTKRGVGHG